MQVNANDQAFQTLYLASDPDDWKEKIVFLDPIQENEIAGVAALKSMELESLDGLVFAAPYALLREFRTKIDSVDQSEGLGKLSNKEIISRLFREAQTSGLTLVYKQPKGVVAKLAEGFFDPLTRRRIVERGAHYFDPSLPTVKDMEELSKKRRSKAEVSKDLLSKKKAVTKHLGEMCSRLGKPRVDSVVAMNYSEDNKDEIPAYLVSLKQKAKKASHFEELLKKHGYHEALDCYLSSIDGVSVVFDKDEVSTTYALPAQDAKTLLGLENSKQLIPSLINLSNRWCKTGCLKGALARACNC